MINRCNRKTIIKEAHLLLHFPVADLRGGCFGDRCPPPWFFKNYIQGGAVSFDDL